MARRWGLGPVFAVECVAAARRRQVYSARAWFVALLLVGLGVLWAPLEWRAGMGAGDLARLGRQFAEMLLAVQLAVVLLAAPAATAGAICIDKARGALLHVMATDLSDGEVVAGKLAARLVPVLALLACGLPVLALGALLGGIEPASAVGGYVVTVAVATLGCALALTLSVWARKPHQALLATYAVEGAWLGIFPLALAYTRSPPVPPWLPGGSAVAWAAAHTNPFVIAFAPDVGSLNASATPAPPWVQLAIQGAYAAALVAASAGLLALAAWRFRPVVLAQASRPARRGRPGLAARIVRLLPGPPLDGNPVLWREWHRKRPTRWAGRFWLAYAVGSGLASLYAVATFYVSPLVAAPGGLRGSHEIAAQVNAWEVAIGLLLLSVSSATALAEERDRGSLDVIMATPLPTATIVWGKWWAAFAMVPRLAILPIWVCAGVAMVGDSGISFFLMVTLILSQSAAIVSLGLALATWARSMGRAVALSVTGYLAVTFGWFPLRILLEMASVRGGRGVPPSEGSWEGLILSSPFFGVHDMTWSAGQLAGYGDPIWRYYRGPEGESYLWALLGIGAYSAAAVALTLAALGGFDRGLGRVGDRPRPAPGRPTGGGGARGVPATAH